MSLAPGVRLGAYEIVSLLGSGGMGEVYRARDTRLKREVAVKTLPERSLADPDSLARFQREGELLATLNHPNIAAIYGFEETGGTQAIVMELVEGLTLAERIASGPLPITEALTIAHQMAEALETAHERGVIHRDLKPANVKVTSEGHVKVLDFGLAKLAAPAEAAGYGVNSMSPTLSAHATVAGVLLGTAAYMSPEQARAKPLDKRTDIWSFGCVLYEMLTGKRAFDGAEITDVLARIIEREPDFGALPAATPAIIHKLLRRCLEKDRKRRLPDIGVARLDIAEALTTPLSSPIATSGRGAGLAALSHRVLPWAVATVAVILAAVTLISWQPLAPVAPAAATQRLTVELGADVSLMTLFEPAAALSPDGQTLTFVAQPTASAVAQLYVRRLDQLQAMPLAGTEGARGPFFSPDGQWIGFFEGGKLRKIATAGGPAVTLADAPQGRGALWGDDDTIVFQPIAAQTIGNGALLRVSSGGGTPEQVTSLAEGEVTQRYPQVLPGGNAILFTSHNASNQGFEDANIVVQSQSAGSRVIVRRGGYYARYLPSGHLVYILNGTLFAAPFDLDRYALTGEPVPVVEGVATNTTGGFAHYAVSNTGTLVYLPGQTFNSAVPIFWMDRQGRTTSLRSTPSNWSNVQFAPNGRLLAIDVAEAAQTRDIWVYDWGRDALSRLTFDPAGDFAPVWTPDSRRIVFSSQRGDKTTANLYWQRADGSGDVQRLTESGNNQYATSWHPNGKLLVFIETIPPNNNDLMILPIEGDEATGWRPGKPTVFLSSPYRDDAAEFSPDGRWIAYQSNESGSFEVYVRPFPGPGGKWQISNGGGNEPTWSRTRPELFFRGPGVGSMMVATYAVEGDSFRADRPRALSEMGTLPRPGVGSYALHPDGERFAMARIPDLTTEKQDRLVFIFNFFDELRRIAPPNGPND